MKPRTVFITLEVVTDLPIKELKQRINDGELLDDLSGAVRGIDETFEVKQIQVNVVKS